MTEYLLETKGLRKTFGRLAAVAGVSLGLTEGTLAAICHFPAPGFGRLVRLEGKRMWQVL